MVASRQQKQKPVPTRENYILPRREGSYSNQKKQQEAEEVVLPSLDAVVAALAEKSLFHYARLIWPVVEPKTKFVDGWHIHTICEHLEAVTAGEINRLIINIPPRMMKSLLVSVFWPTWEWGPRRRPWTRWLYASYAESLSKRDSLKCRRIIQSPLYQRLWGHVFQITSDQNEKLRFENDKTGYRVATSVGGLGTGEGGDRIVCDDPHNVKDGESDLKRNSVLLWWDESMSTRLDDELRGAKVIVMQRTHENDLTGHILAKEGGSSGYVHLCLPARYESNHPFVSPADIRKKDGEVLWKEKFPEAVLDKREAEMTEYAVASQHQQRPQLRGGGMFKVENFEIVSSFVPADILRSVRYWDKAATEGGGARSAGVLMHAMKDGTFLISDVRKGQWSWDKREKIIHQTARSDGIEVTIWVEQEPGSGGKESAENTVRNLAGFKVFADRVTGSKVVRAEPYAVQVNQGNVKLLKAEWNTAFLHEHENFPAGRFKDQVDSAAGSFNKLTAFKRAGVWGR